ncbi:MAG: hypothetical protein IKF80_09650, partial [Erysipelotrichaceae bacterium]|nr:hypothetical protein [Erysipelotrichaceae bacterium]
MNTKNRIYSRTDNTIRNITYGIIGKIISLVIPFFVQTLLIYKLGVEYSGISSLFSSILQVLSATELGFSSAIIYSMYEPVAKNDYEQIICKVALYKTIYKIVGSVILILGALITPFLPHLIKGTYPSDINIYIVFWIYLVNTVISYFGYGYKNSILIVYQRNDLVSKSQLIANVIKGIFQILILHFFTNYYLFAILIPISTLLFNLYINHLSNAYYPELNIKYSYSLNGIKDISKQIGGIAIGRISLVCRNSFDSIILSSLFGLSMTTIYSNYFFIFSSISGFMSIIINSMSASVGNSLVTNSIDKNEEDHIKFDFYYECINSFCTICLFCLYQPFMKVWVGEKLMLSHFSMSLFCLYFYINQLSQIRSVYSEAAGLWWHFRYFSLAEMILNLILNFYLGHYFSVNGILFSTIITSFISSFIICSCITYDKLFKKSPLKYFLYNLIYFILTLFGCYVVYGISGLCVVKNWTSFFAKCILCGVLSGTYILICAY